MSWLVYDTEKGGIIEDKDRVIRIDPDIEITEKSIEKHGITKEISQNSEYTMADILREFGNSISKCDAIIAHNITFDDNIINEFSRNGIHNYMDKYRGEKHYDEE